MWELDHKESWVPKTDAFEPWCWRRLFRVSWRARISNQSILREISPEYSLEGPMLKLQYFDYLMWKSRLVRKDPDAGKDWGKRKKWWQRMRWLNRITNSMDMNLGKPWEIVRDKESWHATIYGVTKSHTTWWLNKNNYSQTFILRDFPEHFSSVQSLSQVQLFVTPWTAARQASLSITYSQSLPKPISIESVMPSNHLILCRPLFLLPSILPSIRVFSNESALRIRWPKYIR